MTNSYYTKSQVDEQALIIGQKLREVSDRAAAYTDSKSVTPEEREKLAGLESSKFLGSFLNPESIPVEGATAGNYADVDSGAGTKVERWIFDVDTQEFVKSSAKATADTAATIKTKYESNPNTNAFTDEHKTKLEALFDIAPASSIESFLEAFNYAILGVSPGTVLVDLSSLQSDFPSSTPGYWKSQFYSNDAEYNVNPEDPLYFKNIYSNKIIEEINLKYPDLNLSLEEVSVSYNDLRRVYNVAPNTPRVLGTLEVEFYQPT